MENFSNVTIVDIGLVGRVYKATDNRDGQVKALKLYPSTWNADYFENEIDICSKLNDDNLVKYLDGSFRTPDGNYVVLMEFCDGGNLRQVFHKHREARTLVDASTRKQWLIQLAKGLEYLHNKGYIHRDVNPRNVMFKGDNLKIGDFRVIQRSEVEGNTKLGSLRYKSPEVANMFVAQGKAANEDYHTSAADIWSFGCIMYELYTGLRLISEKNDLEIIQRLSAPEFQPPPLNSGDVELDKFFQSMLSKTPQSRPTASEIVEQLSNMP